MRADVSVQCADMDAQEHPNAYFPVRWFGRDGQFFCPTSIPFICFVVSRHLRCSIYETPVEQEGDILPTMFQHTAHIWYFRAVAIATVASLRIMQ